MSLLGRIGNVTHANIQTIGSDRPVQEASTAAISPPDKSLNSIRPVFGNPLLLARESPEDNVTQRITITVTAPGAELYPDGSYRRAILPSERMIEWNVFSKGTVVGLRQDGSLESALLVTDQKIQKMNLPKGSTVLFEGGKVSGIHLGARCVIKGLAFPKGSSLVFDSQGNLAGAGLPKSEGMNIKSVKCAAGTNVRLHDDGNVSVRNATLAAPLARKGITCPAGAKVTLDRAGNIEQCVKPANN